MNRLFYLAQTLALTWVLSGCLSTGGGQQSAAVAKPKPTLAERMFAPVEVTPSTLAPASLQSLRDSYASLFAEVTDPATRHQIQARLADLEMLLAEERQEQGAVDHQGLYARAIEQYQQILNAQPDYAHSAEVLYQLSKAHELQGDIASSTQLLETLLRQFPQSEFAPEAWFRRGERFYAAHDYSQAIDAYAAVLGYDDDNPYYLMSAYMLGWSYFKLDYQDQALVAFTRLLDKGLAADTNKDASAVFRLDDLDFLTAGDKRLVTDTLRIMALLFSYQGDEAYIARHFSKLGERDYVSLLYAQLGQQFINDDRYRDSARVYQAFVERYPNHALAPEFAVRRIDSFILGDFPSLVLPAKQQFVAAYGLSGKIWDGWSAAVQESVKPFLHQYLQELAGYQHSLAQQHAAKDQTAKARAGFIRASEHYEHFIALFPDDALSPKMLFSLAESRFEAQQWSAAIDAFERYAYQLSQQPNAAEAGYSAIVAHQQWLAEVQTGDNKDSAAQQREDALLISQEQFVAAFASDARTKDVMYDSMQRRYARKQYPQALAMAQQMRAIEHTTVELTFSAEQQHSIMLVTAHSQFALAQFADAEQSYALVLQNMSAKDKNFAALRENLAASIYRQAEQNFAVQQVEQGLADLMRVLEKAPGTATAIVAQFDAANQLLGLAQWQQATALLTDFRQRYPNHALTPSIQDKLIHAYQEDQQWALAAHELHAVWLGAPDSEQGREALYIAAGYFERAGDRDAALERYRSYAHKYPAPFAEATEARFKMSEFYRESGEDAKRRFWLKKLIDAHRVAGANQSDRSRYLAAMASLVFADDNFYAFKKLRLTLPLKTSLKNKKSALDKALSAYRRTLDYGVAEFSTAASYRIADVYHQLSKDLMASQRPAGLDELALEQYELLLEEQAYPFEEQAIDIHSRNAQSSWQGVYDDWVKRSFDSLARLMPGRYNKQELIVETVDGIE